MFRGQIETQPLIGLNINGELAVTLNEKSSGRSGTVGSKCSEPSQLFFEKCWLYKQALPTSLHPLSPATPEEKNIPLLLIAAVILELMPDGHDLPESMTKVGRIEFSSLAKPASYGHSSNKGGEFIIPYSLGLIW